MGAPVFMQQSPTLTRTAAPSPPRGQHSNGMLHNEALDEVQCHIIIFYRLFAMNAIQVLNAFGADFGASSELISDLMIDQDQILRDAVFPSTSQSGDASAPHSGASASIAQMIASHMHLQVHQRCTPYSSTIPPTSTTSNKCNSSSSTLTTCNIQQQLM